MDYSMRTAIPSIPSEDPSMAASSSSHVSHSNPRPLLQGDLNMTLAFRHFSSMNPIGAADSMTVLRFNQFYQFSDIWTTVFDVGPHLNDASYYVVRVELSVLCRWNFYLTAVQLRGLCQAHGIRYVQASKTDLIQRTLSHACSGDCARLLYGFKILSRARPNVVARSTAMDRYLLDAEHRLRGLPPRPPESQTQSTNVQSAPISHEELANDNHNCLQSSTNLLNYDHLEPPNQLLKEDIIREWQEATRTDVVRLIPCAVCGERVCQGDSSWVDGRDIDLQLLQNPDLPDYLHPSGYNLRAYSMAILYPKGLQNLHEIGLMRLCKICSKALMNGALPKFALANSLYYARDRLPVDIRTAFAESSVFERMLISRARSNSICCRFSGSNTDADAGTGRIRSNLLSRARKGVKGNVMVAPLDHIQLHRVLPPSASFIKDTMCAVFVGNRVPTRETIAKFSPVLVRKSRVQLLLEFLISHNAHYSPSGDFYIEPTNIESLNEANAECGVPPSVHLGYLPPTESMAALTADYTSRNEDTVASGTRAEDILIENVGYTEGDHSSLSYHAMKGLALERCLRGQPFLASGTGNRLLPDFDNPSILTWLFPHLDPWGIGGFHHPRRRIRISMEEQVGHLLRSDEIIFRDDAEFPFVFYNVIRKMAIARAMHFKVPRAVHTRIMSDLLAIDVEALLDLCREFERDSTFKPVTPAQRHIARVLHSVNLAARHVPGSDGYKVMLRNKIRGLIYARGTPTLFVTLNPSDVDNPLVRVFAGEDIDLEDFTRGEDMDAWSRQLFSAEHPGASMQFFDFQMRLYIRTLLRYGSFLPGFYGKCDGFFASIETQGRGALHCHFLIWLRGHLSPQDLRDAIQTSPEYKTKLFQWLESIIQCEFPGNTNPIDNDPSHAIRVRAKDIGDLHPGTIPCPLIQCRTDRASYWQEVNDYLCRLLNEYNWHVHTATCWKYLKRGQAQVDSNCRMGMNGLVVPTSYVEPETGTIILRRRHPWISAYSDLVTVLLKCNTNVQFVGSGDAAKAFVYYVTDYITKPSLPMHIGVMALTYAINKGFQLNEETPSNLSTLTRAPVKCVNSLVNSMLGRQEISHPQVLSYLIGGGDHYTCDTFSTLQWGAFLRYVEGTLEQEMQSEQTVAVGTGPEEFVELDITRGSISISSQVADYIYRPGEAPYEDMCLYDLASITSKSTINKAVSGGTTANCGRFSSSDHPQYRTHRLQIRRKPAVPVILGPSFNHPSSTPESSERWARDMLLLFWPWRQVSDLRLVAETWLQSFERIHPLLSEQHLRIIRNMTVLIECADARYTHRPVAPSSETDDHDNQIDVPMTDANRDRHDIDDWIESHSSDIFRTFEREPSPAETAPILDMSAAPTDISEYGLGEDVISALDDCFALDRSLWSTGFLKDRRPTRVREIDLPNVAQHGAIMQLKRKRRLAEDVAETVVSDNGPWPIGPILAPFARIVTTRNGQPSMASSSEEIKAEVIQGMNLNSNNEQLHAFNLIADHVITRNPKQLLMYIAGVGGTGKSHVIKSVVRLFDNLSRRNELLLGAPTGIAAVLIGGYTLHALAMLSPVGKGQSLSNLVNLWKGVRYLIVDEISMVGAKFISQLSNRMRQAKGDSPTLSQLPFGGVNVIFLGDFGQLKPPRQYALYSHELINHPAFPEFREDGISSMASVHLWRQVDTVIELKKNIRQAADDRYATFLARLRVRECKRYDHHNTGVDDYEYLQSRLLTALQPEELAQFQDAPFIIGSKLLRDILNIHLIRFHASHARSPVHTYYSRDSSRTTSISPHAQEYLWSIPSSMNGDAFGRLPLFIGMKVMITENIAFDSRIVNGSEGHIVDLLYDEDASGKRYAVVAYVCIPGIGFKMDGLDEDIVPIFPVQSRIEHGNLASVGITAKSFTRRQLPLVPAYAYTDFKGQGRTLPRVFADLTTARGQGVYVMLSRVTSLSGLVILRWFPPNKVFHRLSEELRTELNRISDLERETRSRNLR